MSKRSRWDKTPSGREQVWTWREKSHSARITDKKEVKVMGVGGWGWDGRGAGFLVCNVHFGLFERQTLGCTRCGGDVRLCHSQTCGVCVWRVGWGCERERERRETGGLRWSSSVGQKREGNERTSLAVQWLGCRTFTAGVKAGS